MVCIYCGHDTQVINSRLHKRTNEVWRRRKCTSCGSLVTTYESIAAEASIVVQYSDTDLRPFSRDTLFTSIYESCKHRPTAIADATALTQTIMSKIFTRPLLPAITREAIIAAAQDTLELFDGPAATYYKAYHRT
jgi:transcriptional regulator NrdR family protein